MKYEVLAFASSLFCFCLSLVFLPVVLYCDVFPHYMSSSFMILIVIAFLLSLFISPCWSESKVSYATHLWKIHCRKRNHIPTNIPSPFIVVIISSIARLDNPGCGPWIMELLSLLRVSWVLLLILFFANLSVLIFIVRIRRKLKIKIHFIKWYFVSIQKGRGIVTPILKNTVQ